MAEKGNHSPQAELEIEIRSLQHKIQKLNDAHAETLETCEMENLEEEIEIIERILNSLQGGSQETNLQGQPPEDREENFRHSTRPKNPTPKMLDLLKEEAQKKGRKFVSLYERWKIQARERKWLKMDLS